MTYKILLFNPDGGAPYYIVRGYINAFRALGHEAGLYDGKSWNHPDIFINDSGWRQEVPLNHKRTKLVIHVNPWGKYKIKPENINEPYDVIDWVRNQKPDLLFGYAMGNLINKFWNYWIEKMGIPVLGLPTAADSTIFKPDKNIEPFYDVSFVGGRWNYKNKSLDKWLDPLLYKFKNHIIYGWGGWQNTPFNYKGSEIKDIVKVFNESRICPAISEPHTQEFGIDIPERIFKTALCNCVTITDKIKQFEDYNIPDGIIPMAKSPEEMITLAEKYISSPKLAKELTAEQQHIILERHTYIVRAQNILDHI